MSVAFRRESDDEHLEPKFELPIPPGPNLVTPNGLRLIEGRLAELDAAVAAESEAEALKKLRRDQRYWQTRRATAEVMASADASAAAFGTRVTYRLDGAAPRALSIVGDDEADPAAGTVSFTAPLARAMIGAEPGETVDFGERTIEVVEVVAL